jgi:hypothetical protein
MRFILAILIVLIPLIGMAQPAGHNDPRLQSAIQAWLADNDQTALPAFAALATEGNTAAQILLGRLNVRPPSKWLDDMNWKDRRALTRSPDSIFGASWLKVAAENGDPLAKLFRGVEINLSTENDFFDFLTAGELTQAQLLIYELREPGATMNWPQRIERLVESGKLGADMQYARLYWQLYGDRLTEAEKLRKTQLHWDGFTNSAPHFDPGYLTMTVPPPSIPKALNINRDTANQYILFLITGALVPKAHDSITTDALATFGRLLNRAPPDNRPLAPLRHLCSTLCKDEVETCLAAGVARLAGYEYLRKIASPSETLIPFETYATSPRAIADLQRTIKERARTSTPDWRKPYRKALSCFDTAFPSDP